MITPTEQENKTATAIVLSKKNIVTVYCWAS